MKKTVLFLALTVAWGFTANPALAQSVVKYKDPHLSADERTADILSRMTLEEKVGQLLCPLGWEMYEKKGNTVTHSQKFEQLIKDQQTGMLWATLRADPWTKKTLDNGLNPAQAAEATNALQRYAIENSRLGIPVFLAEEAPHGHMAIGATVFPAGIGQASTWNPELLETMGKAIASEVRVQGGHIAYGPVLDLSLDPRWSRVEESMGEDPQLSGILGAAVVRGTGGGDITHKEHVISTLKHFIAYGASEGGHNGNAVYVGMRSLHEKFLPPFRRAVDAGALSIMSAYNAVDGIPSTSNKYLFTDVLVDQWKFRGFAVSDLLSIDRLAGGHCVASSIEEAAILATEAGVTVDLGSNAYPHLIAAVRKGAIKEAVIDSAAYRVLRMKFEMGLFENPYVVPQEAAAKVGSSGHRDLAKKVAEESIVLLENKQQTLPLSKQQKIAVIGPNADNQYNMLGDYTAPQETEKITTVLEGIIAKVGKDRVEYVKGCAIRDTTRIEIDEAVAAAQRADVVVAVVGGSSARDFKTKYIETGAAVTDKSTLSDMESGEGFDRATLGLMGKQLELLQALKATGKPLVVVYIQGRPLNMNWAQENADALLTAWYPGEEGGSAVANVLYGDYNPSGRLPISVPRSVGQLPVYYNQSAPTGRDYIELTAKPLYSFGYGLSYTQFDYKDMIVKQTAPYTFEVSFTLTNTGACDGEEVAQLYMRDDVASVAQPVRQLKNFKKVFLKKGEEKQITLLLNKDDFSIINQEMARCVEPGDFTLMVGSSSDNIQLKEKITIHTKADI
jgi:Beta-glucosidase-related glycosidases